MKQNQNERVKRIEWVSSVVGARSIASMLVFTKARSLTDKENVRRRLSMFHMRVVRANRKIYHVKEFLVFAAPSKAKRGAF